MANIRDVARRAGVSPATVSRIINADDGFSVTEETRRRVWAAINALGYLPVRRSRNTSKAAPVIGTILNITVEGLGDPSFLAILEGAQAELSRCGASITRFQASSDGLSALEGMDSLPLDGFLMMHELSAADVSRLRRAARHIVAIDSHLDTLDSIGYDHYAAGKGAAEHLLAQGYRHFALLYGSMEKEPNLFEEQCLTAFVHTVQNGGGLIVPDGVIRIGHYAQADCRAAVQRLLARDDRPDALFLTSDLMAVTAVEAALAGGIRVGPQLGVMGLSGSPVCEHTTPTLTTMALPLLDMGACAASLLLARIGSPVSPPQHILLPATLIARGSTCRE